MNNKSKVKILSCIVYIVLIFAIAYHFSVQRCATSDYVSINGDFQSYNVFRRTLDGQTPYVDFSNYIGMAPIWVNVPFIGLKNTFTNSLFVTTFTSCIVFCIAVLILFYLVTNNLYISLFASAFVPKLISTQILHRLLGPKYGYIYTERFSGLYTPSNSMRGLRSFLPFLLCLIFIAGITLYSKRTGKSNNILSAGNNTAALAAAGFICGMFMPWSNDYGVACIVSFILIFIILSVFYYKYKPVVFAKKFAVLIISVLVGIILISSLITKGNPAAFFRSAANTAEYQFFYFHGAGGKNVLGYIFTTPVLWCFTFIFISFWLYALYKLINKEVTNNLVLLVFITLSITAATFIYIAGGSGYNCREPLEVYSILFVIAVTAKIITDKSNLLKKLASAACAGCMILLTVYCSYQAVTFVPINSGVYIDELGGYSTQVKELVNAKEIVDDETVFSTYATGLEVVTNQFQPTGYDYIIHALGKDVQNKYAQNFTEGKYRYVHTSSLPVESWVSTQNWYLYRHILPNYKQIYKTEYAYIWERCEERYVNADVKVEIIQQSDSTVVIKCTSDNLSDFVADISVDYTTEFSGIVPRFLSLGRKSVSFSASCFADDNISGGNLPGVSVENIPVKMKNGQGQTVLNGVFGKGVNLSVNSAKYNFSVPCLDYTQDIQ